MRPIHTLLLAPLIVYVAVTLAWHAGGLYPITGDEPHYLLTADSLLRDGDLAVVNNHALDTPVRRALPAGAAFADTHSRNGYSIHGLGLPLLIAPAYALGGVLGAQLLMAALAGLAAPLCYRLARAVGLGPRWAVAVALGVGLGQPYVAGAGRVYPDLLAGLIMLHLLTGLVAGRPRAPALAPLLLACLPWLHLKLLLPAALLGLAAAYAARAPAQARAAGQRRPAALCLLPLALAALGLGAYNYHAFGSPLGPYGAGDASADPAQVALIFAGLHLDRMQGLLLQAPLLWLALPGLAPLLAARPRLALLAGALYLSVALPQAAHTNWYGGGAPAGRFHWALAPLWCLPLAYAARDLISARRGRLLAAALAAALLLQAAILAKLLIPTDYAYTAPLRPAAAWLAGSPLGDWLDLGPLQRARWLPSFQDAPAALRSPINWAAGGLALAALWSGRRRVRPAHWAALLLGAALAALALPPPIRPLDLRPAELAPPQAMGAWLAGRSDSIALGDLALRPGWYAMELHYQCPTCQAARWTCALSGSPGPPAPRTGGWLPPGARRLIVACGVPPGAPDAARLSLRLSGADSAQIHLERLRIWPLGGRPWRCGSLCGLAKPNRTESLITTPGRRPCRRAAAPAGAGRRSRRGSRRR